MRFQVGIIGCGRMANTIEDEVQGPRRGGLILPYCHAGGYVEVEETEMVAACDIAEDKLNAFTERWNVPRGYTDFHQLIDEEKPDILSITTRPEQHAEAMIYGAENGVKGMYAEKPLCCSLTEADAIKEALQRNNVFLEFGPMRRNWAVYRQARQIAESGQLGEIKSALGFSGNSIGGHFLDTLLYLLDDPEPVSISGTLSELHTADGDNNNLHFVQDTPILSAFVRFDNDTSLHAAATGISGEYELVCQEGIIRIQNDGESIRVRQKNQDAYDPIEVAPIEPWSGTAQKIRELVESIKTGKPGISNLRATMLGTEIGFGLYESHLQGGIAIQPPIPNRGRWVSSW
ncbi:MAG: Gfo/Idh/MocA family oxidoreductase [Candidatus Poribacteria bacterium]